MKPLDDVLLEYIDRRLAAILRAPPMWGSDEAVEMQVLQLLELRAVAVRPNLESRRPRAILDAYVAFLHARFPRRGTTNLAAVLEEEGRQGELPAILREFCDEMIARTHPENVYEAHDVVLGLRLREGLIAPPAAVLSSYYDTFRRVVRGVARPVTAGRTGKRAPKDIEAATDFLLAEVRVVPANGAPARVILPLDRRPPTPEGLPWGVTAEHQIRDALAHVIAMVEWAAQGAPPSALAGQVPDDATRQEIALQTLRLLPRGDVVAVEIGGKLVARVSPVVLGADLRPRIFDVLAEGVEPTPFEVSGEVRALDLDEGTIKLKADTVTHRGWVSSEVQLAVATDAMGCAQRVRASGKVLRPRWGKPLWVIDTVELLGEIDEPAA